MAQLENAFGEEHERTYGHRAGPEEPVELVNAQLIGLGIPDRPRIPEKVTVALRGSQSKQDNRRAYFGPSDGWLDTPVLQRLDLKTAQAGPCIVEEYDATCLVPPGANAHLDDFGNIVIAL